MPRDTKTTAARGSTTIKTAKKTSARARVPKKSPEDIIKVLDIPEPEVKPARVKASAAPGKTAKKTATKKGAAKKATAKKASPGTATKTAARARAAEVYKARRARPVVTLLDMDGVGVGAHLLSTAHAYEQVLTRALADGRGCRGLTVPRLQVLQVIAGHKGICGAEASRAMGVRPQTLTYLLSELSRMNWIVNTGRHGRAQDWALTATGRRVLNAGWRVQDEVEANLALAYRNDGTKALIQLLEMGREHLAGTSEARS